MYDGVDVKDRWRLLDENGIIWNIGSDKNLPHTDHLEMSGRLISQYIEYGVDEKGELVLSQIVVWPSLRTIPNNTHASLKKQYIEALNPIIEIDGVKLSQEKPYEVCFDGILTIKSMTMQKIEVIRTLFPCREYGVSIQKITLKNHSNQTVQIYIEHGGGSSIERGSYGIYILEVETSSVGNIELKPQEEVIVGITFSGRKLLEEKKSVDVREEEEKRRQYIRGISNSLKLETPEPILNQAFSFAKIRAAESVFQTKNGLMHSPGGLSYYAAVWTNDEGEYAGPFFPYLGEEGSIEASLNAYRLYRPFMGPDYRTIPTSIIAEGIDIWEGARDRGDAAMYAYGAANFALSGGDIKIGEELWPAIEWCLECCQRKMTPEGVIASDSDELEGRFPTGKANLSTASLTYGGLRAAAHLGRALGKVESAKEYDNRADRLYEAIESYFGSTVEGYETYRYYEGNDILRSWICLPLTMGIMERKEGTINALFSPNLWTEDGLATQAGDITFWDRSTLYGLRGVFAAGESERSLKYLMQYSRRRTLGEHIPYAVEAYPEGNQRHLSAESALYCRIYTEGLFGIMPVGFESFSCKPNMPKKWDRMAIRGIKAFGNNFDLVVVQKQKEYEITLITQDNKTKMYHCLKGDSIMIKL